MIAKLLLTTESLTIAVYIYIDIGWFLIQDEKSHPKGTMASMKSSQVFVIKANECI